MLDLLPCLRPQHLQHPHRRLANRRIMVHQDGSWHVKMGPKSEFKMCLANGSHAILHLYTHAIGSQHQRLLDPSTKGYSIPINVCRFLAECTNEVMYLCRSGKSRAWRRRRVWGSTRWSARGLLRTQLVGLCDSSLSHAMWGEEPPDATF